MADTAPDDLAPTPEEEARAREEERKRKVRERVRRHRARKRAEEDGEDDAEPTDWELLDERSRTVIQRFLSFRAAGVTANARKALSPASQRAYKRDLVHFGHFLAPTPLLDASPDDVAAWLDQHTRDPKDPNDQRPWSRRTAHRKRSSLNSFYDWALQEELVSASPMRRIKPRPFETPEPVWLSKSRIDVLFEAIESKIAVAEEPQAVLYMLDACIFRLMFNWGLRVSEATNLSYDQIRYHEGEMRARVVRKGDKEHTFPITGEVERVFRRWHRVRQEIHARGRHTNYVFVHPQFRKRVSRKRAWIRLQRIAKEAGFSKEELDSLSPHKLRHSLARYRLESGDPINVVQAVLGHSDVRTTQVYLDLDEEARLAALRDSNRES